MAIDAALIGVVRTLIWDLPQATLQEPLGIGDGQRVALGLAQVPVVEESLQVWVDGVEVTEDVTVNGNTGIVTFDEAPAAGAVILADYRHTLLSEEAVISQLEAYQGNTLLAAARCLEVLLLDPQLIAELKIENVSLGTGERRAAMQETIRRYRAGGGYAAFQMRVDSPDWDQE